MVLQRYIQVMFFQPVNPGDIFMDISRQIVDVNPPWFSKIPMAPFFAIAAIQ